MESPETICAVATAPGRAGVAIIRLSGPQSLPILTALTGQTPPPRQAQLANIRHPQTGDLMDQGLILYFPAPNSFTGEDIAELHIHGSRAVQSLLIEVLIQQPGCRLAQPGEFTKRAFYNGKKDLTSVEGLADLINAETSAQHQQALRQMEGKLGEKYENWRYRLLQLLAHAEADIDFSEEDLDPEIQAQIKQQAADLLKEIKDHMNDNHRGERIRDGIRVAIMGAPNAGKSSLLNLLAQREAAIVSDIAGTTRDIIEIPLDLGGFPVIFADTAGIREDSSDKIEKEGIKRAQKWAENADIRILLLDSTQKDPLSGFSADFIQKIDLFLCNKIDIAPQQIDFDHKIPTLPISVQTGENIDQLTTKLIEMIKESFGNQEDIPITRARHRHALAQVITHLTDFQTASLPELQAENLRLAVRQLGIITGAVDVEDVLDIIFHDFCIGK